MKILSLFDGISGAQQALFELIGDDFEYYASEIDKYALKITEKNYPTTVQLGDATKIDLKYCDYANTSHYKGVDMGDFDLFIGGSPCQDLSCAGSLEGLKGSKSKLFYEYVRILQQVQPKYFVLENVASMTKVNSMKISEFLYGIPPMKIDSGLLTAQSRNRLYWVGKKTKEGTYVVLNIPQPQNLGLVLGNIWHENAGTNITERMKLRKEGTLAHVKAYENVRTLDQKAKCLTCGGQGISNTSATNVKIGEEYFAPTPNTCETLQGFPQNYTEGVSNTRRYETLGNAFTVPVIKHSAMLLQYLLSNIY